MLEGLIAQRLNKHHAFKCIFRNVHVLPQFCFFYELMKGKISERKNDSK